MLSWALVVVGALAAAPDFSASLNVRGEKGSPSVATLSSDGQRLLLDVEVVDATPAVSADPVHSDHVEVWLALEPLSDIGPTRFVMPVGGRHLLTVDGKDDADALDALIQGTAVDPATDSEGAAEGCEPERKAASAELGKTPSRRVRAFFGLAHLGLFPDGRTPVLYDAEAYAAAGLAPALGAQDIRYEATKTERGYHLKAWLQPGALVFIPRGELQALRVRVDAVDAGGPGAKEVLRSTHPAPKWGEPSTFQVVKLAHPLTVKRVESLPELDAPGALPVGIRDAFEPLPRFFMRMGDAWRGVESQAVRPQNDSRRVCRVELSRVAQHLHSLWEFGQAEPVSDTDFTRVSVTDGSHPGTLLITRTGSGPRALWVANRGRATAFRFKDGAPGVVLEETAPTMGEYTSGQCGGTDETTLSLVRLEAAGPKRTPVLTWGSCSAYIMYGPNTLTQRPGDPDAPPEVSLTWASPNDRVRVSFGEGVAVDVRWKPDGTGIAAQVVPPPKKKR
ncbi:hypothetical protein DRW03_03795 [Corallococcus sp. H22C18031201]|nr:hypothetical protein DRW03_03795 [Corallococcus sp. H22C18031201]